MRIRTFLFFIIIIFSCKAFSTNIRVLDIQNIIENNINLVLLYDQITKDQIDHREKFITEELNIQNELERIEKLNLILDPTELQKEIENYNEILNNFNDKIEKFNLHYDSQINDLKNNILNITLDVLKNYSDENKIDLILDSNNYILSSNSINITNTILDEVNKIKIEIDFEKY